MLIRPARSTDAADLVPLYADWGHPAGLEAVEAVLAAWSGPDDRAILVAQDGAVLTGFAAVVAVPHLAHPGSGARLVGLVAGHAHRRRGVASALLDAVEQWARDRGCDQIDLTSARIRTDAHRFYPARGYEETSGHHARYLKRLDAN